MGHAIRLGAALVFLGLLVVAVFTLADNFSFSQFAESYEDLARRISGNMVTATAIGVAVYTVLVISLLPGVPMGSVAFGLVYGWFFGTLVVLAGTAAGVAALYGIVRYVLPERFGGQALDRLAEKLQRNLLNTMLFLRLMPPVPFSFLNVALPSLKVPFVPYVWTTIVGMGPRLFVYALAGEGLRTLIDQQVAACANQPAGECELDLSVADFLSPQIVAATVLLALVAAVPLVWRWVSDWRARRGSSQGR